jgi:deazaflavin-dependent oxidoreductase (nitroreductase family)
MTLEIPPPGTRGVSLRGFPIFRAFNRLNVGLYRLFAGRLGGRAGLLLTTIGARSGRSRTVALGRFADGEGRWLVVGSLAGAARHPAWFINLARNPDRVWVQIGHERFKVRPELLRGDERTAAWQRIVTNAPGYGAYERSTDREIPVVRLTREASV